MSRLEKFRGPESRGAGGARGGNREIRFEMEPENLGLSDRELVADLRRVARRLGVRKMTGADYDRFGCVAAGTVKRRFGGWNRALAAAGLGVVKRTRVTAEQVAEDLQRVARRLKTGTLTRDQYKQYGRFGANTVARRFASWNQALRCSGLLCGRTSPRVSVVELFDNLEMLWVNLGRQPRGTEVCKPVSRFNLKTYKNRFGGIRAALRAFVAFKKSAGQTVGRRGVAAACVPVRRTPRNVNFRLRYLILRRDHFRCCACGRSPANEPGVQLEVDHVVAWSAGGETVEANLQTLCERCNGGKADL